MGHLTNADFMCGTAKIEEAVVNLTAATHQHIAGNTRVETARNQRQDIFLRADWVATNSLMTPGHQQKAIVFNLKIYRNLWMV